MSILKISSAVEIDQKSCTVDSRRKPIFPYSHLCYCIYVAFSSLLLGTLLTGGKQPSPIPPAGPPLVEVEPAVKSDSARELHLSGSLSAERSISLSFSTVGTVKKVKVKEGDAVRKDQIPATLDPSNHKDSFGIAEAKAKQVEDAYNRMLPMYQNKTAPAVKMVEIETGQRIRHMSGEQPIAHLVMNCYDDMDDH